MLLLNIDNSVVVVVVDDDNSVFVVVVVVTELKLIDIFIFWCIFYVEKAQMTTIYTFDNDDDD